LDNASKEALSKKIENKLDEFFGEDEVDQLPIKQPTAGPTLEKLKSMVLSIDWEITDECLDGLIGETDALIRIFQKDPPTHALLRMLKALANYIRKHKAQAHQEAIKRVMSVFASLESIVQTYPHDEEQKNRIVVSEIKAFNLLKERIGIKREAGKAAQAAEAARKAEPKKEIKDVKNALTALEAKMNTQIEQIKEQLAVIKKELANYDEK
jgi:hypothetical protein